MGKCLVMFIGNSTISIVEQYRLHLRTNIPVTFILPHKNDVVLKKLFNVLQSDMQNKNSNTFTSEIGSGYFLVDEHEPFMKTKREENYTLIQANTNLFVQFAKQYDHVLLVGESSCSFDAVVIEAMLEQAHMLGKTAEVLSWCPIHSPLATENHEAVIQAVQTYGAKHTIITAQDENPDGFLSLFKAYNREIAQAVSEVFQQQ